MKGTISKEAGITLPDLLQIVCVSGAPGSVIIQDKVGSMSGVISVANGRVINASFGPLKNHEAIRAMLAASHLDFNYIIDIYDSNESILEELTNLLLQCSVDVDETKAGSEESKSEFTFHLTQDAAEDIPGDMKEIIRGDCEYLQYHAARIGSALGYDRPVSVAINEDNKILAFKLNEGSVTGLFSSKVVNAAKALEILG